MEQPMLCAEARRKAAPSRRDVQPIAESLADARITVVVPLYNEYERFERFAGELVEFVAGQPAGSKLIFVDDGSADGTAELVESLQREAHLPHDFVRLLRRPHRGKGAAVRAGLDDARTPVAGFCDLDLSTPLADFTRVIDAARDAPILAIASRGLATSRYIRRQSRVREFLGRSFNKMVQLAVLPGITDTQCGAKVSRTELWHAALAFCREDGFAWDVEILAIAATLDISVQEIAVDWRHEDESKVRLLRDGTAMLRALARIRRRLQQQAGALDAGRATLAVSDPKQVPGRTIDARTTAALTGADGTHWWFRSKAAMVNWALERWGEKDERLVDLGAGAGGVTAKLGWSPRRAIVVESNPELVSTARRRHSLEVVQGELEHVPVASACAHVVCLLDVVEHLAEPGKTLREAHRLLTADGHLIVNVPGHPRLWSAADVALGHVRRYTRATLRTELEQEAFEVLWCSHVFSWLVLPVRLRRRRNVRGPELGVDVDSALVDRWALLLGWVERLVLRFVTLPVGTSVLAVARPRKPRGR
jgi:dolichyl-phosphate beta-glucosyltransferase